jgi:hypothetical protein
MTEVKAREPAALQNRAALITGSLPTDRGLSAYGWRIMTAEAHRFTEK